MFQSFNPPAKPSADRDRLQSLRDLMVRQAVDGYLVPHADEHQGEYVPPCAERLAWLTGFTGSAGLAVVLRQSAALFVDGRYVTQAPAQVDRERFEILQIPAAKLHEWLIDRLPKGGRIGFDPRLHVINQIESLQEKLRPRDILLKPLARNPVDRIWGRDRPAPPAAPVFVQPLSLAGKSAADKIAELQKTLLRDGQDAVILTQPDSICWLFNIRGQDVAHNPVVLAHAIVPARGRGMLFMAAEKIGPESRAYLKPLARILPPDELAAQLRGLKDAGRIVRLDPASASWWFYRALGGGRGRKARLVARATDPCLERKAIKTAAEIKGARAAHLRDGVAMCRFLAWLDNAPIGGRDGIDEITAVRQLEQFRRDSGKLVDISFDTIAGSGPHGAIVHYRVDETTNRKLRKGELFLVDSGGQYRDGTTDITRTIAIGRPSRDMRRCYTAVLKGHINIATARFPAGTRGIDLDPFARRALWDMGLDYDHGTGHGVGSFLSVHEGPQSISRAGMAELKPGMIISNEPGYYRPGAFGIRLENLILVKSPESVPGGERDMMSFETLTLAPFDNRLIDPTALTPAELSWLNRYHTRLRKQLAPLLDGPTRKWLNRACRVL